MNRGSVMDQPPLTDDGYCGLKVVTKGKKGSETCRGGGGVVVWSYIWLIGADSANCGFNSRRFTHSTERP